MKQFIALCLIALSLLAVASAIALAEVEPIPFSGSGYNGLRNDLAYTAEVGTYYLADNFYGMIKFTSNEAGAYLISHARKSETSTFCLYSKHDEVLTDEFYNSVVTVTLKENTDYYIKARSFVHSGWYTFAICSPSTHAALGEEHINQEPTCTEGGTLVRTCEACNTDVFDF